jgi:hypothetical protein
MPEGWRMPSPRELAQQMRLLLDGRLRHYPDGWRRFEPASGKWWPCDSFGKGARRAVVLKDGQTEFRGTREPVENIDECRIKPEADIDETREMVEPVRHWQEGEG